MPRPRFAARLPAGQRRSAPDPPHPEELRPHQGTAIGIIQSHQPQTEALTRPPVFSQLWQRSPSTMPERNARFAKVVRRHLHVNFVADANPDKILAHFAGNMGQDFVAIRQGDAEHGSG